MPANAVSEFIQQLRGTMFRQEAADVTDAQLLDLFLQRRDEAALEALIRRHGSMVWAVCRRILSDYHDTEDAFQATFLVFVRKAASILPRSMVANWLYGVAHQTALKARATAARRKGRERQVMKMPEPAAAEPDLWNDLQSLLDQELSRLPDRYRVLIVLCDLEGKTRKEAARQLGLPEGTVASRVARARTMLARRLARHGITASGGALAVVLAEKATAATVPNSVVLGTIKSASLWVCGSGVAATASSTNIAILTEGVLKTMLLTKLKAAMTLLLAVGALSLSTGLLGHHLLAAPADGAVLPENSKTAPREKKSGVAPSNAQKDVSRDSSVERAIRRLAGTWAVWHVETNGKALVDDDLKKARITFEGDRAELKGFRVHGVREFAFKLDPNAKPTAIDVTFQAGPHKGETFEGIYVIHKDEVRICLRLEHPEHGRPKGFVTNSGNTLYTFILKRPKES